MESDVSRRPLTDLVFLARASTLVRAIAVLLFGVTAALAGTVLLRLQVHFAARASAGASLGAIATALGRGSVPATAAAGWVAAALFGLALLRMHREPLEPPVSLRSVESLSATQLRRGLRREYTTIRLALLVLCLVSAVDVARLINMQMLSTPQRPLVTASLAATTVEAAGLVVATLALAAWAAAFGARLRRLAAL